MSLPENPCAAPASAWAVVRTVCVCLLLIGLGTGCGALRKIGQTKRQTPKAADGGAGDRDSTGGPVIPDEVNVGEVAFVDRGLGFVLVRTPAAMKFESGTALWSVSSDVQRTTLIVSPEKNRSFLVADIKAGSIPRVGDSVFAAGHEVIIPDAKVVGPVTPEPEAEKASKGELAKKSAKAGKLPWWKRLFGGKGKQEKPAAGEGTDEPVWEDYPGLGEFVPQDPGTKPDRGDEYIPVPPRQGPDPADEYIPVPPRPGSADEYIPVPPRPGPADGYIPVPPRPGSADGYIPVPPRKGPADGYIPVPPRKGPGKSSAPEMKLLPE